VQGPWIPGNGASTLAVPVQIEIGGKLFDRMMITQVPTWTMATSRVAIGSAIIRRFATISVGDQVPADELTDLPPAFRNHGTIAVNATTQSRWISAYLGLFPAVINAIPRGRAGN